MNTDEFLEELKKGHKVLNNLSNAIASSGGITDSPEYGYLKDKMGILCTTAEHVLGQLRNREKEQKYGHRNKNK